MSASSTLIRTSGTRCYDAPLDPLGWRHVQVGFGLGFDIANVIDSGVARASGSHVGLG